MADNEGIFLPAIDSKVQESKTASPKLTHRPNTLSGHVFLSPQAYVQRSQGVKQHIDLDHDIHRLSTGSPSSLHSSPSSCPRDGYKKERESHATKATGHNQPGSRSGSPLSYRSQSPASTPGLRRRKLEHKISPLAGDNPHLCDSVPNLRPRAKSFSAINRSQSSRTFRTNLVKAASRDSLDVGLSRLDVTDNVHHSDKTVENNNTDVPVETLEKCQKWLEGVAQAGGLERPLNAVVFNNIDWSDG